MFGVKKCVFTKTSPNYTISASFTKPQGATAGGGGGRVLFPRYRQVANQKGVQPPRKHRQERGPESKTILGRGGFSPQLDAGTHFKSARRGRADCHQSSVSCAHASRGLSSPPLGSICNFKKNKKQKNKKRRSTYWTWTPKHNRSQTFVNL